MKQYIVDAFTDRLFCGNPAAVCVMDQWISEELMIKIAIENNLSETAFAVKEQEGYRLRWFTPGGEIDLCGHATLATAFILLTLVEPEKSQVMFHTASGKLIVNQKEDGFEMDFPAYDLKQIEITDRIIDALGARPTNVLMGRDLVCVMENEDIVRSLTPDMEKVKTLEGLLLHVTAQGKEYDCVSRSFAPKLAVTEDPVCGSGHCHIVPYWLGKLHKNSLRAYQASGRSGILYCRMEGTRVFLKGKAVLFSVGELQL